MSSTIEVTSPFDDSVVGTVPTTLPSNGDVTSIVLLIIFSF